MAHSPYCQMCSVLRISVFATFFVVILAIGPKSVHLSLDTRIHIDPEDTNTTYKVINKISSFLHKIKYALTSAFKDQIASRRTQAPKYLTNFLKDVAQVILKFGSNKIGLFFKVLYNEIKSYFEYKGSGITDIVNNSVVRGYLLAKLKDWSEANPLQLKTKLKKYMDRVKNKHSVLIRLGSFLNYYYKQEHEEKMKEFVRRLKNCRTERDFVMVVREAIYRLVIQHYGRMNYTIRTRVNDEINRLGEHAIERRFIKFGKKIKNKPSILRSGIAVVTNDSIINENGHTVTEHNKTTGNATDAENKNDVSSDIEVVKRVNNGTSQSSHTSSVPVNTKPENTANHSVPLDKKLSINQNVPLDIKLKAVANIKNAVQREYIQSVTKRRLKKLSTTTRYVPGASTPMLLKRFSLKYPPKNDNVTLMTNVTSVPIIIINGTQNTANVPRAIDDVTKNSSQNIYNRTTSQMLVPQVIKNVTSMKMIPIPQDVPKKSLREQTKFDKSSNTTGLRVIDVDFGVHKQRPRGGKYTKRPVLQHNLRMYPNSYIPEVKVFVNTDNPYIGNRDKYYMPPKARLTFTQKEILDIEDRIDAMNIDGK